jgi:hypothetical protein
VSGDRRSQYAQAFYEQASSDWQAYEALTRATALPRCHALHYLQMACEKLGKAYRLRNPSADIDAIVTRHVGFAQFVNEFLRSPAIVAEYKGQSARHKAVCKASFARARGLETYPWERGDWEGRTAEVLTPCKYNYPSLSLLDTPGGGTFLKLVKRAFRDFTGSAPV